MMTDDTISDLKQFIAATVSHEVSSLKDNIAELDIRLSSKIDNLSNRIDDIDAKLGTVNEATGEHIDDHEQRITKLETKAV